MADDLILKIKGVKQGEIKGESKRKDHLNQIDLTSINFGMMSPSSANRGGGAGVAAVTYGDLSFTKKADASSHALIAAIASGEPITEAIFYFRKQGAGAQEYLQVTLENSILTNYSFGAHGGSEPVETISISYAKIKFTYKEQDEKGKLGGDKVTQLDVKAGTFE